MLTLELERVFLVQWSGPVAAPLQRSGGVGGSRKPRREALFAASMTRLERRGVERVGVLAWSAFKLALGSAAASSKQARRG